MTTNKKYKLPEEFKEHVFSYFKKTMESGKAPTIGMIKQLYRDIPDHLAAHTSYLTWKEVKAR